MDSRSGLVGIIPIVSDPVSLPSAVSGAYRLWETYSIDRALIITTGEAQANLEWLKWWLDRLGIEVEGIERVKLSLEDLEESNGAKSALDRLASILDRYCGRGVVLLSSASRRLASLLTAASLRRSECSNTLVHNDFYFGPWSGLHYPYTPLRLEPILVVHPLLDPSPRGPSASRAPRGGDLQVNGRKLPPLRAAMAELARILNEHAWSPLTYPGPPESMKCGRLKVRIDGVDRGEADLCTPSQMEALAYRLSTILHNYIETSEGYPLRSVLAWVGLANLKADTGEGDEFLASLVRRQGVIADTSLVYYGLHRYYWEGASVDIPDCVLREVHRRLAESLKRGMARDARGMADILAYLGLKDMLWGRPPIVPSPPGDCDTAVPKIDPVILHGKMIATADDGAYRYWRLHPSSRLARPVKVFFTPEEKPNFEAGNGRVKVSRLYYGVYQTLLVLKLMESQQLGVDSVEITVKTGEGEKHVNPPIGMLLNALNLRGRGQRG